jgi:acetyltransferase-like isoleucine patch superfamily enzyme
MHKKQFVDILRSDLNFPDEYNELFDGVENGEQLGRILKNKDSLVNRKISQCNIRLEGALRSNDLVKKGLIKKTDIGEIVVVKSFAIRDSLSSPDITIRGPVALEKNVVVGRSAIFGPAYIAEKSRIHDSRLRGELHGAVYIGQNCALWDYTVIIRSLIGNNSLIHTCNVDDSIVGPNSHFGATKTGAGFGSDKKPNECDEISKLDKRIVLANFSFGNKIKIYDPAKDIVVQTEADHLGTISGNRVWLNSGTIIYPGTIIGRGAQISCLFPLVGYIPPGEAYSLFLSITKSKSGEKKIQPKGTLVKQIREHFIKQSE